MRLSEEQRQSAEQELQALEQEIAEAERRGLFRQPTFREFVEARNPGLLDYEHIPRLVDLVDRIIDGFEIRREGGESDAPERLIVNMPPRYFKSEVFSRLLTAYFLRRFPELMVGIVCHTDSLALEFSEDAQENFREDGGRLKPGTTAKSRWSTREGGELWATGVSAQFMGRGYHLGVVDDPIDPEKATSPIYQRRFRKFWPEKFLSRQEPGALIILVMQRLGMEDPVDFLYRREIGENTVHAPEGWHVVVFDEVKSEEPLGRWEGPKGLPETCTVEPDPRDPGEILAPSRFNEEQVAAHQRTSGPYTTSSQRQQRPMRPAGDFWQEDWFRVYDELPSHAYNGGKDWDTAYTAEDANAASAFIESYRGPGPPEEFDIYIHDVDWAWKEFPELIEWMKSTGGPHFVEEKASGKSAAQTLRSHGIPVTEVTVKGDKLARAAAAQPYASNRRIHVRREIVNQLLLGERQGLLRVTTEGLLAGAGALDVNDAFVQAVHRHAEIWKKKKGRIRSAGSL